MFNFWDRNALKMNILTHFLIFVHLHSFPIATHGKSLAKTAWHEHMLAQS